MAKPLVSDELWELVEPLIPKVERRYRFPGRMRIDDRKVLTGILFVLKTGIPWEYLPQEMGCGSGMTCWRRLQEWQQQGVWRRLHEVLLASCTRPTGSIGRGRRSTARTSAPLGGRANRAKPCRPRQERLQAPYAHLRTRHPARALADRRATTTTSSNAATGRRDPARARQARPPPPPTRRLLGDGATTPPPPRELRARGISAAIPRRSSDTAQGWPQRWVVERTISWLHQFRRLGVRDERRADIHEAFLRSPAA